MKINQLYLIAVAFIMLSFFCTKKQDWGSITIERINGKIEVALENSHFQARYKNSITSFAQRNPVCIAEFYNKKADKELVAGGRWDDILDPVDFGGDPFRPKFLYRDRLLSAKIIHDGPGKKTVHLNWENTEEEVTIFPDSPVIQIDYIRWYVLIADWSDWSQHPDAYKEQMFVVYGADDYYKTYDPNDTTRIRGLEDDEVYYSKRRDDPEDGGPLNYNGHFIVGTYKIESGVGFGRIFPVDRTRSFKLWRWRGWEIFPSGNQRFRTYLFTVNQGPKEIIALGKKIVDTYPHVEDTFPPEVRKIYSSTPTTISIEFNEQVDPLTAKEFSNYQIDNHIDIRDIEMGDYSNQIVLKTSPLNVGDKGEIKIEAIKDHKGNQMKPMSIDYIIPIHPPAFNISSGLYYEKQTLIMSSHEEGTQIRYTLNGMDPDINSILYEHELEIDSTVVVKARSFKEGYKPSDPSEIVIKLKVPAPVFNIPTGIYSEPKTVEITCNNKQATIHYTVDRSPVTESSTIYTDPMNIVENTLIKAKAFKKNWEPSEESYLYLILFDEKAYKKFSKSVEIDAMLDQRTVTVKIDNDLIGMVKINIFNQSGRLLNSFEFDKTDTYFQKELAKLRFGLYFIEVTMGDYKTIRKLE